MTEDGVDVLLPLGEQKGKHFADKFTHEEPTTFWYQDERRVVCGLHHHYVMLIATGNSKP